MGQSDDDRLRAVMLEMPSHDTLVLSEILRVVDKILTEPHSIDDQDRRVVGMLINPKRPYIVV